MWTLRGAHLGELKDDLIAMNWWWVGLAVVTDVAVYFIHGSRWRLLLYPVVPVKLSQTVQAIYVGLFANEVLPFRAGEVLRCYLLSRWTRLPLSVGLASALIERIFDGIWLCLGLIAALQMVQLPRQFRFMVDGSYVLGGLVLAGAILLAVAMFRQSTPAGWDKPLTGARRHFAVLMEDLRLMGHSRYLATSLVQSLPYLLLQVIPIWAAFRGYGLDLSMGAAFVLLILVRLGTVVPQAPGNLGLFQFLVKECLERIFQVPAAEAARFSLLLWGIITVPLLVGGSLALALTGTGIGELHRAAEAEKKASQSR